MSKVLVRLLGVCPLLYQPFNLDSLLAALNRGFSWCIWQFFREVAG